ncbi:MAG: hypothetical protein H8J66_14835 [Nitrospira sp.]|nr:hypothetical protein [Nitrospira sp.]
MRFVALSLIALLAAGCASITSGTTQEVSFQSNPDDVTVTITKQVHDRAEESKVQYSVVWKEEVRVLGKTPLTNRLDRAEHQTITFSKDGYKPLTMPLTTTLNGYFWGNIVTGGFIGSTTDSMTGAMYEYSPSQYFVTLIPLAASSIDSATQQSAREKAKGFIVLRYSNLMADLSRGHGEDLQAVLRYLHVDPAQDTEAIRKMQALSQVYPDAAIYADRVIELYLK